MANFELDEEKGVKLEEFNEKNDSKEKVFSEFKINDFFEGKSRLNVMCMSCNSKCNSNYGDIIIRKSLN